MGDFLFRKQLSGSTVLWEAFYPALPSLMGVGDTPETAEEVLIQLLDRQRRAVEGQQAKLFLISMIHHYGNSDSEYTIIPIGIGDTKEQAMESAQTLFGDQPLRWGEEHRDSHSWYAVKREEDHKDSVPVHFTVEEFIVNAPLINHYR